MNADLFEQWLKRQATQMRETEVAGEWINDEIRLALDQVTDASAEAWQRVDRMVAHLDQRASTSAPPPYMLALHVAYRLALQAAAQRPAGSLPAPALARAGLVYLLSTIVERDERLQARQRRDAA